MALWNEWSGIQRLLALKAAGIIGGGASWAWQTVTGSLPLTLTNAVSKAIKSLVQYGKTVQSATPTPSSPQDIVINNGVVRYGALGRNLCDPSAANTVLEYVAYGRAKTGNDLSDYNRVAWYDSTKTWISGADYTQNRIAVVTAPSNAAYARFSCNPSGGPTVSVTQELVDSYNWMFAEGNAEITPFVPFDGGILVDGTDEVLTVSASGADSQTASVVDLYSVGEVADEQEIIGGMVTKCIGYHVFDGTETFSKSSAYGQAFLINAASATWGADRTASVLCTHFLGLPQVKSSQDDNTCFFNQTGHFYFRVTDNSDANAWKAWLAEQYAAGTPVIVWFVLAESTTESPHSICLRRWEITRCP